MHKAQTIILVPLVANSSGDGSSDDLTPQINLDDIPESSTNELPLSAITFRKRHSAHPTPTVCHLHPSSTNELPLSLRTLSDPSLLKGGPETALNPRSHPLEPGQTGRRQRHSIAGQMSYFKVLGFGTRRQAAGSTNSLFSTAVISGSSSAPNLRDMIPNSVNTTTLEGFGGVPAIRPLETLHNALSLRQLDVFLEAVTCAPPPPTPSQVPTTQPMPQIHTVPSLRASQAPSTGWSGPPSVISSSGGPPSGLSSEGPSSPNSNCASTSEQHSSRTSVAGTYSNGAYAFQNMNVANDYVHGAIVQDQYSNFNHTGLMQQSITSGEITPISTGSEWEFNTMDATAGSTADHDLTCTEEEDEATISVEPQTSILDANTLSIANNEPQTLQLEKSQQSTFNPIIRNDFISGSSLDYNLAQHISENIDMSKYEKYSKDTVSAKNINATLDNNLETTRKVSNVSDETNFKTTKNYFTFETGYLFKENEASQTLPEYKTQRSEPYVRQMSDSPSARESNLSRVSSPGALSAKEIYAEPVKLNKISKSFHEKSQLADLTGQTRRSSDGVNLGSSQLTLSLQSIQQSSDSNSISSSLKALNQSRHDPPILKESPRKYPSTGSRFTTVVVSEPRTDSNSLLNLPGSSKDESQNKPLITVAKITNVKLGFNLENK